MVMMLASTFVAGQGFIVSGETSVTGRTGEDISTPITITNVSEESLHLTISRASATLGSTQETWFCWGEDCFDKEIETLPLEITLAPGESTNRFSSALRSGLAEGSSSIKYLISDKTAPDVQVELEIIYDISDQLHQSALFTSRDITLNDVYPNPVTEFAVIDYKVMNPDAKVKIVMHNILGSIVGEFVLQPLETRHKINAESFNPGVYFYTLYVDNDGLMTRKLIVQK